jgi:DNA-directed RNA polymerase subunit RPC12/RpoP
MFICKNCNNKFNEEYSLTDDINDETYYLCPHCKKDNYIKIMNKEEIKKEVDKCVNNPYYFATNYLVIKRGNSRINFTTKLSEQEFNKAFKEGLGKDYLNTRFRRKVESLIIKQNEN